MSEGFPSLHKVSCQIFSSTLSKDRGVSDFIDKMKLGGGGASFFKEQLSLIIRKKKSELSPLLPNSTKQAKRALFLL